MLGTSVLPNNISKRKQGNSIQHRMMVTAILAAVALDSMYNLAYST